jgi:hypothetical protein
LTVSRRTDDTRARLAGEPLVTSAGDTVRPARVVLALSLIAAAAAAIVLAGHVASYFFLFDDFALNGQASRWPLRDLVATPLFGFYRPALFLLMRGAHGLFGWHAPQGYSGLLIGVHVLNALLVGRLAHRIAGDVAAWPAAALFLLSPWSAEAVLWVSGGFDVLATAGTLVALLGGLAFCGGDRSRASAAAGLTACALGTLLALFAKESAVTLSGLFGLVVAAQPRDVRWRRAAAITLLMLAATAAYLVVRRTVLASLGGGVYGDWLALMAQADPLANLRSHLRALLVWPAPHDVQMRTVGLMAVTGPLAAASMALLLAAALFLRRWTAAWLVPTVLLPLLPVLWLGLSPGTSGGGRVLYLPGVLLSLMAGLGVEASIAARPAGLRWSGVGAAAVVLATAVASLHAQAAIWAQAGRLSRATIEAFRPHVGTAEALHIDNLPFWFEEGPYVIKSYAFGYYYFPASVPPVSATALSLVSVEGRPSVTRRQSEPGAAPTPEPDRRVQLAIDLR